MKVTLLSSTPQATKIVATAAWICTHEDFPTCEDLHPDKCGPLVRRVLGYNHMSILEHASFTFGIEGISRACSHQLVRYRIASFSQQSQRYVTFENFSCIVPASIPAELKDAYREYMGDATVFYDELLEAGVPPEDARFVLPNAATTKLVMTMNARELRHFFAQRCCAKAQWEIRELATAIRAEVAAVAPVLFADSGPDCGNCKEKEPCKSPD